MNRIAVAVATMTLLGSTQVAAEGAKYTVTFNGTWTAKSHPVEYPSGAHFSGLIGAIHNDKFSIFKDSGTATPGLERLSEMGQHSPLDQEIRDAIKDRNATALLESGPIFGPPGKSSITFDIEESHPLVSLVAMIAPSPDWFAGIANVSLLEKGKWVQRKGLTVYGWDAGTDSGTTYRATDADTMPRDQVRLLASPQFWSNNGRLVPVGTMTFVKIGGKRSANR